MFDCRIAAKYTGHETVSTLQQCVPLEEPCQSDQGSDGETDYISLGMCTIMKMYDMRDNHVLLTSEELERTAV
jgi:hypothetical protein